MVNRQSILEMLQSAQEEERLQGLKAVVQDDPQAAIAWIFRAMGDDSWRVRKEAADLFLSLPVAADLAGEVVELLHSTDNVGLRNTAAETLILLGRRAVPPLLEEVGCNDQDVRKFVLDVLGEIGDEQTIVPMIKALADLDINVRAAAAENLGKLGATEAVPHLLAAMADPDLLFRFTILEALGKIGERIPIARLLEFEDDRLLRKALFECLGRVGGSEAVHLLVGGLCDQMRNVREAAALALQRIATRQKPDVVAALARIGGFPEADGLIALLKSASEEVRRAAVVLLGWADDPRAAAPLLALLDDEAVREPAVAALTAMGPDVTGTLLKGWPDAGNRTRAYLAYLAGEVGCAAAVPYLAEGMTSEDAELKLVCAQSLGKLEDETCLSLLIECLGDDSSDLQSVAVGALGLIGRAHSQKTKEALLPMLESDNPQIRMYAIQILGPFDGADIVRSLSFAMKDESSLVRRAAVRALEEQPGESRLEFMMIALTDEDSEVRRLAAESLGLTGVREALKPLELALQDEDIWVRASAVRSLGNLGGEEAIRMVGQAMNDPVGLVSIAALETLSRLAPEASYPVLVQALSHPDEEVVTTALDTLAGSGQKGWIRPVREFLINHRHWEVRTSFIRALAELEGVHCRDTLETRLLVEGEELVRQQIQELLRRLANSLSQG